ncbi:tetratricopeptide repeat protein [Sphingomonas phyllosphaerae]|uniref:tetratricopeptide repeat protein n=1 Tax=Sphingomonas phyllosphaerae TaxID=257003 RepID=UPI0003B58145|nr:tetratricopeptide repeat protein [Sphingomonas phyllosphaerae]
MRNKLMIPALAIATMVAVPAFAKDRVGYQAIAAGSMVDAERTLQAERAIFPERPELMLNLAAVYARTGRDAQARALYGEVLGSEPVAMDMADGSVQSSHALAQKGLSRLATTMATR